MFLKKHWRPIVLFILVMFIAILLYPPASITKKNPYTTLSEAISALGTYLTLKSELEKTIPELEKELADLRYTLVNYNGALIYHRAAELTIKTEMKGLRTKIGTLSDQIRSLEEKIEAETWQIEWINAWMRVNGNSPSPSLLEQKNAYARERTKRISARSKMQASKDTKTNERKQLKKELNGLDYMLSYHTAQISNLEPKVASLTKEVNSKATTLEAMKKLYARLPGIIAAQERFIAFIKEQIKKLEGGN